MANLSREWGQQQSPEGRGELLSTTLMGLLDLWMGLLGVLMGLLGLLMGLLLLCLCFPC